MHPVGSEDGNSNDGNVDGAELNGEKRKKKKKRNKKKKAGKQGEEDAQVNQVPNGKISKNGVNYGAALQSDNIFDKTSSTVR